MADPKQDESFRVIDRRLFNPDGEIRDEKARAERHQQENEPAVAAPSSVPVPNPKSVTPSAPQGSSLDSPTVPNATVGGADAGTQAVEASGPQSSRGLEMLINFVAQNAAMLLGAYPDPRTGQAMLDLDGARELIDMLDALRDTTRGNLSTDDNQLLLDVLGSLKLSYMEMTKAAAKAMKEKAKARP